MRVDFHWICFTVLIELPGGGFTCPLGGFKVNDRGVISP